MRFVIQRVTHADVKVDGETIGEIGKGFMVLIGVADSDTKEIADKMIKKMIGLRIFEDEEGKTNLSLDAVGGSRFLYHSLHCMLTVKRVTVQASSKQVSRIWLMRCMNTSLPNVKNP